MLDEEQADIAHLEAIRAVEKETIIEPTYPGSFRDKEQFRAIRAKALALDVDEKWKKRLLNDWLGSLYKLPSDVNPQHALQALHNELDLLRADYWHPALAGQKKDKQKEVDDLTALLYATKGFRVSRWGVFWTIVGIIVAVLLVVYAQELIALF